jgi:hypothetical protein
VSVVELDGNIVGWSLLQSGIRRIWLSSELTELAPRDADLLPSPDDVVERGSSPEVLQGNVNMGARLEGCCSPRTC